MKFLASSNSLVDDSIITWEIEADSAEEAELKAIRMARKSPTADSGSIFVEQTEDDFQEVLDRLAKVLEATVNMQDVVSLIWDPERKEVAVSFMYAFEPTIVKIEAETAAEMIAELVSKLMEK